MSDRIKVVGYSQRTFFENGIEYRNFSPDLVGLQLTSEGGTPLFTMGNFNITTNMEPKTNKVFITNRYSNFVTLTDLDLTVSETIELLNGNAGVKLNLDKSRLTSYALFGSLTEFVRVSLENIITKWPASLYIQPVIQLETDAYATSGYTVQNYSYNPLTEQSTFSVSTRVINNKFQLNYLTNGTIINTFNASNDLRNLTVNYQSYVVLYNGTEYPVLGFTGATDTTNDFIEFIVKGDVFSGMTNDYPIYHIKPSKLKEETFFNLLSDFEKYILNRQVVPLYTADFKYSVKSDTGALLFVTDTLTWPVSDGYNIDFDTTQYEDYATSLLDICVKSDSITSNLMTRFLVSESISSFDTIPVFLDPLHEDTSGQKINKTLNIYGRSYDDINNFITGIAFAHTVTYDKNDNVPDIYIKNLAKVLGWDIVSSVLENNLLKSYVTTKSSTYSGQTVGLTAIEADTELWRRLILNTPWLWKSKGTRKAIEFLFRFIGAPNGLVSFNEYVYLVNNVIDMDLFENVLALNNANADLFTYPVDLNGYPSPLADTPEMYFQNDGLWHRETGGPNSVVDILTGNNPHVGPYDGGSKYINQFKTLIPNFSAVTVSSQTMTTSTTNLFTNYNRGSIDGYTGNIYVDAIFLDGTSVLDDACYLLDSTIISNPNPLVSTDDCGCDGITSEQALNICVGINPYRCDLSVEPPIKLMLNSKGNDGNIFYVNENETPEVELSFDYLFKFECETLKETFADLHLDNCRHPLIVLETLDVSVTLDKVTGSTYETVWEDNFFPAIGKGNLYNYLSGKTDDTGFYVCGGINNDNECHGIDLYNLTTTSGVIDCQMVNDSIVNSLFLESGLSGRTDAQEIFKSNIDKNALQSTWQNYSVTLSDDTIISAITNEKIKLSIKINNCCVKFCILLDNIKINKKITKVLNENIFVTKSPGFELERIRDNKKSWLSNSERTQRTFDVSKPSNNYPIRVTDYYLNDARQVINSKEVDLDISLASAIETDVWCYITDNPCLLTGVTYVCSAVTCTGLTQTTGITATTVVTAQTIVTASTVITATTATTVTTGTTTGYTCSSGYTLSIGGDACIRTVVTGATFSADDPPSYRGFQSNLYGNLGTVFYSNLTNNGALPVNLETNGVVKDQTGGTINAITTSNNSFWGGGGVVQGRLNNVSLLVPSTEYVGISKCLDIETAGTYYIGIGSDNLAKVKINGELVIEFSGGSRYGYEMWHVFPYYLTSGLNILEFEGKCSGGSESQGSAFGVEVYQPLSLNTLVNSTTSATTGLILSSIDYLNNYWDLGTSVGYSCPSGYALNRCGTGVTCTEITKVAPTVTAQTINISATTTVTGSVITTGTTMISGNTVVTGTSIISAITFTCCSPNTHCGDNGIMFDELLTEPLSAITSIEDFKYIITSELIDAKNRQTISNYSTLRALYDRYMNSSGYCATNSSGFNYENMNKFVGLIGNYWVDLIEQVIPSTTIWGSTKIYTNTLFDDQKFKYKSYSLHFGENAYGSTRVLSPCIGSQYVDAITTSYVGNESDTAKFREDADTKTHNRVYIIQNNSGSEFVGMISKPGQNMIYECSLLLNVVPSPTDFALTNGSASALVMGNYGPVTYLWSNGETTQSIYNLSAGTYSVTVTDTLLSGCSATAEVVITMNPEPYLTMSIDSSGTSYLSLSIDSNSQPVWVEWGDGALSAGTGSRVLNHLYSSPYTGPVEINAYNNFSGITTFETLSATTMVGYTGGTDTALHIRYSIDEVAKFTNLETWSNRMGVNSTVRGDVALIPRTLNTLFISTQNTSTGSGDYLYGSTYDLPSGLTSITIVGSNTISGNTLGLPRNATYIYIDGTNTISGDTSGLPLGLTYFNLRGQNTLSGNTTNIPSGISTTLLVHGNNTISGPLSGLPSNLVALDILGNTTISGSTYDFPRGLEFIELDGANTVTGDVLGLPTGATFVYMIGSNTISGKLSDVIDDIKYLQLEPCMLSGYTSGKTWTNDIGLIRLFPETLPYAFSTAEVDAILIDLTGATFSTPAEINLQGTSEPRSNSAQVLAALTILTGSPNNVIVVTN